MIGVTAGVLIVGLPIIIASGQVVEKHEAMGVADSAALAAADALLGWVEEEPCAAAERVAAHSQFTVIACNLGPFDVTITVQFGLLKREVQARAGSNYLLFDG